jgi:uncharacterized protein (TIGR02172 family)
VREVTIDNYSLIGRGVSGECYRCDDETILKLYYEGIPFDVIEKEKMYARAALIADLPTAISFDIVSCGNRRGVVYELLNARTLTSAMVETPERFEEYAEIYIDLCRQVHRTKADTGLFPDIKDQYKRYVERMGFINRRQQAGLFEMIDSMPDAATYIHGDLHTGNIMIKDDELFLIDMGDMCAGHHMFDFGQIFNLFYVCALNGRVEALIHMPSDMALRLWEIMEKRYFGAESGDEREAVRRECIRYRMLNLIRLQTFLPDTSGRVKEIYEDFILPNFGE